MNPSVVFPRLLAAAVALAGLAVGSAHAQGLRPSSGLNPLTAQAAAREANEPRTADYIVAVVNNEPITHHDVRARLQRAQEQLARSGGTPPDADTLREQVLDALILEKAQLQLATEMGLRIEPAMLDEAERNIARQNQLTLEQMHAQLRQQGLAVPAFRENLRQQLLLQRLREREVESRVRVTEMDIDRYVQQKLDNPGPDLQLHLAHLLVAVPEQADAQTVASLMTKAQQLAERARAGEDFASLARTHSDAPDRTGGGSLGVRTADRYPALFVNATRTLAAGGVAGPVRSPAGFHVLKVLDKRITGLPDAEVTQTRARHILLRPSANLSEAAALAQLAQWRQRILRGEADFADLAKAHSQDGAAPSGGDLGWANPGLFVPEFEEVMNALAPNQVSEPTLTRFGVHLIQVLERRTAPLSPREQREQLRFLVREEKLDEAYRKWIDELRIRAYVERREPPA